jgi:hypothetical protein
LDISKYYYDNKIRDDGTGEEYRTHRRDDRYKIFFKNQKEMEHFRDLGIHGS